jgi:hypothetical protein
MKVRLQTKSDNRKTGPIAVSTTEKKSCPPTCPLAGNNACYAKHSFTGYWWNRVEQDGMSWDEFVKKVSALPCGSEFRHNQAGDLPGSGGNLHSEKIERLAEASSHLRAFTYTHYPINKRNLRILRKLNVGMTVNLSADTELEADLKMLVGLPVVLTCREDAPKSFKTVGGNRVIICPEQTGVLPNCKECMLCAAKKREYIIGFRAHGAGKGKINKGWGE